MTSPTLARLSLDRIAVRDQERGFVCGGTDSGKSTLMDELGAWFVHHYAARHARRLILDSKPRYRAQWTAAGTPASRRYRRWAHGAAVPGSVVVDEPEQLELAWRTGARTVIAQCDSRAELARLVSTAAVFLADSRASRPQLLQVDETLDFYHSNGSPRGGNDVLERASTGGRERGTAALYGAQRTRGIPPALMGMMSRLYAFRIDYRADAKRYAEMGAPERARGLLWVPAHEHEFYYWWKGDRAHPREYHTVYGPLILALPEKTSAKT